MRWSDLAAQQPGLWRVAARRLVEPGVLLVGTVRRDGTARISPVEPLVHRGDLWLSMLWGSHKAADLTRDPRVLLHSIVTGRDGGDGELKLRGRAEAEEDREAHRRYARAAAADLGWAPEPGRFHLFRIEIGDVSYVRYDEPTGDQHVVRWPVGREYVRRGTSATSLGPPEEVRDVLLPR